jgi:hypothetical protein
MSECISVGDISKRCNDMSSTHWVAYIALTLQDKGGWKPMLMIVPELCVSHGGREDWPGEDR